MKREEELTVSVKAALRAYADASKAEKCPICAGTESCDHTVKERLSAALLSTPKPEAEPVAWTVQNHLDRIDGTAMSGIIWGKQLEAGDIPLYAHPPKPKPVGWETDAEWDLEMRCANLTENTPFAEVSKLINDLWQQYCLAAEPKPEATEVAVNKKLWDQLVILSGYHITHPPTPDHEFVRVCNGDLRKMVELMEATEGVDRQVHHSNPVASQNTQIVERDIYEVANQLGGYVGPDTPERLKRFLLKEEKAAAALADEIVRLRSELANARNAALEEAAALIDGMPARTNYAIYDFIAEKIRALKAEGESR